MVLTESSSNPVLMEPSPLTTTTRGKGGPQQQQHQSKESGLFINKGGSSSGGGGGGKKNQVRGTARKCEPKKNGGGGKGTWGRVGDEVAEVLSDLDRSRSQKQRGGGARPLLDASDPALDAALCGLDGIALLTSSPSLTRHELNMLLEPALAEYFLANGDVDEVVRLCLKMNFDVGGRASVAVAVVRRALEGGPYVRELGSDLLSGLSVASIVSHEDMAEAFDQLLQDLYELRLDTPDAATAVGIFAARAVADDCLPPAYVLSHPAARGDDYPTPPVRTAMHKAYNLLTMPQAMARLDVIWGVHGQAAPLERLRAAVALTVHEYCASADEREAERSIRALEVPHFMHEVVYAVGRAVIESDGKHSVAQHCSRLLAYFCDVGIVPEDQLRTGLRRLYTDLPSLTLDTPRAAEHLQAFVQGGVREHYVSDMVMDALPGARPARRRFVSEGAHRRRPSPTE